MITNIMVRAIFPGYPPWSNQGMGWILWGQPFILTIYEFFNIKLGGTVMFLPVKI
jgi:hypothetical protein